MAQCILVGLYDMLDFETLRILENAFGMPVVSFTTLEYPALEAGLNADDLKERGVKYVFPEFYRKNRRRIASMSMDDLDAYQIKIEKKLGIENNLMLVSFGKSAARFNDYRKSRNYQLLHLMFVEKLLEENDVAGFFNSRGSYLFNLIADACLRKGVVSMHLRMDSFTMSRLYASDSQGRLLGMEETFNELLNGNRASFDQLTLQEADEALEAFQEAPVRAAVVEANAQSFVRNAKLALKSGFSSIKRSAQLWFSCESDRVNGELDPPWNTVPRWPMKALRMLAVEHLGVVNGNPDMKAKFIYLPLHLAPDTTDLYFGKDYCHHEGFVAQLAKRLPSEYRLYVKDHTSMVGDRAVSFYKTLQAIPNVEMIDPRVSTFDLIRNCAATLTVAGTAGWETYLSGKPVIVLGDIFYDFLPNVLKAGIFDADFVVKVRDYLDNFQRKDDEIVAAAEALYASSYPVGEGHDGIHDATPVVARREAALTKEVFDKWGGWILENEPLAQKKRPE